MDQAIFFEAEYQTKKRKPRCRFAALYTDLLRLAGLMFVDLVVHHCRNTIQNRVGVAFVSFAHIIFAPVWFNKTGTEVGCSRQEESFKRSHSVFFHIFQCQSAMSEYF
jgi:hypothetical protein